MTFPRLKYLMTGNPLVVDLRQCYPAGWVPLVRQLFSDIDAALDDDQARRFVIQDVWTKYGELRVTYQIAEGEGAFPHQLVDDLIGCAEAQSERICIRCGLTGCEPSEEQGPVCGLCQAPH